MLAQQSAIIVGLIKVFPSSVPKLRYHLSLGLLYIVKPYIVKPYEPTSSTIAHQSKLASHKAAYLGNHSCGGSGVAS